jgi:hypothetical protein
MFLQYLPKKYLKKRFKKYISINKDNSEILNKKLILNNILFNLLYVIYIQKDFYDNIKKTFAYTTIIDNYRLNIPLIINKKGLFYYDFLYNNDYNYTLKYINKLFDNEFLRLFGNAYIENKYLSTYDYCKSKKIKLKGIDNILNYLFINIELIQYLKYIIIEHTKKLFNNLNLNIEKDILPYIKIAFFRYINNFAIRHHTHFKETDIFSIFTFDNSYLDIISLKYVRFLQKRTYFKGWSIATVLLKN